MNYLAGVKWLASVIVLIVVGLILTETTVKHFAFDGLAIEVECPLEEAGDEDPDNENEEEKILHKADSHLNFKSVRIDHLFVYQINYSQLIREVSAPPPKG